MRIVAVVVSCLFILGVLWDAFETVVLPRRVSRRLRLVVFTFVPAWRVYSALMRRIPPGGRRETYLGFFGPLSIIGLLALWAVGLVLGFGLLLWGLGSHVSSPDGISSLATDLYFSGTTFFTLGLGDVTPRTAPGRLVAIAEAGIGFGFLALVISYLPVLYQAFSRRETQITSLDAWAGSPPAGVELLRRVGDYDHLSEFGSFLRECGSTGRPNSWSHTSLTQTFVTFGPSTTISRGCRPSPPCLMRAPWSWLASRGCRLGARH